MSSTTIRIKKLTHLKLLKLKRKFKNAKTINDVIVMLIEYYENRSN